MPSPSRPRTPFVLAALSALPLLSSLVVRDDLAASPILVCDSSLDRVVRLEDVDGSGIIESAVPGEVIVFYDDASPGPDLSTPSAMAIGPGGEILLLDGGTLDAVLVLADLNGDGDAGEEGEVRTFFDASSGSPALSTPNDLELAPSGWLYLIDDGRGRGRILALRDLDGNGDALGAGEWRLVYDSELAPETSPGAPVIADPEALAIDAGGALYVADATLGVVLRLVDLDGDGDFMDGGEVTLFYDPRGAHPFGDPEGLAAAADGSIYATDEDTGIVVRLADADGDGRAQGPGEVTVIVDDTAVLSPRDTNDLFVGGDGELLVLDGARDQIWRLADLDGDGLMLSAGEVEGLLARGERIVGTPSGIVGLPEEEPEPESASFRRGDVDGDGQINLTDAVVILSYLFLGGEEPSCLDSADVNDDGVVAISDSIALLEHLFLGGKPPAPPYRSSGVDPTGDDLGCDG